MRRAIARGRVFPQSYSTDRRYGRLSLKACALFPLMWANADDQGRLCGDPEEIKYAVCPNVDHITKQDIPELLEELAANSLIKVYNTSKTEAIQLLDWWDVHRPQWAWPSQYPKPEGWQDHLRYKKDAKTVFTQSWPVSGEPSGENSGERSGEETEVVPLITPSEEERGRRKRKLKEEEERGNSPEPSGEKPSPSPTVSPVKLLTKLTECYRIGWGTIRAKEPEKIIPRPPDARIDAQLRDLADELFWVGGCSLEYIDQAFKDAASHQKMHVSYVRKILLAWLARGPP